MGSASAAVRCAALLLWVAGLPQLWAKPAPAGTPGDPADPPAAADGDGAAATRSGKQEPSAASDAAPRWSSTGTDAWPERTVRSDKLPAPPAALRKLVENANVTFVFYDADQYRRKYPGETRFSLQYRLDADFRWKLLRRRDGRWELRITPQLREIELDGRHQILLPAKYAGDDLYSRGLTRHELDHVRISSDPRHAARFKRRLRSELEEIRVPTRRGEDHDQRARDEVHRRVEEIFQQTLDLMRIRYQELDRVTDHGSQPLPETFFEREDREDDAESRSG
jgi:hypothetical protein